MTIEEMKRININNYPASEVGMRAECKEIIKLAKEISECADKPIYFIKGM